MLLRKRAWDIAREDFAVVSEEDTLAEAMRTLNRHMEDAPECHVAIVKNARGEFSGVVSIWDILRRMDASLLRREVIKGMDEAGFDQVFRDTCKVCASTSVGEMADRAVPRVGPSDPLLLVLDTFLKKGRSVVVVAEAGRVLGLIAISDVYLEISNDVVADA
jgi:CBS domain-containing protein